MWSICFRTETCAPTTSKTSDGCNKKVHPFFNATLPSNTIAFQYYSKNQPHPKIKSPPPNPPPIEHGGQFGRMNFGRLRTPPGHIGSRAVTIRISLPDGDSPQIRVTKQMKGQRIQIGQSCPGKISSCAPNIELIYYSSGFLILPENSQISACEGAGQESHFLHMKQ